MEDKQEIIEFEIMKFEIINKGTSFEPNYKRFLLDSYIKWNCPKCGHINKSYESSDFSFPILNKLYEEDLYCYNCEEDFFVKIMIKCELVKK